MEGLADPVSPEFGALVLKLLAAVAAGLALGFDRESRGHAAGMRTHAMVALAAAATAALALELHAEILLAHPNSNTDPLRIIEGLVAAIGFLGGGIIIRSGGRIHGLTTAANLWACGIVGLAFGAGSWRIGLLTVALALVVLIPLRILERRLFPADDDGEA